MSMQHCCQKRQQCRSNIIRLCQKDDILRQTRSTLLPLVATKSNDASTKSNVALTVLLVWTGLQTATGQRELTALKKGYRCSYVCMSYRNDAARLQFAPCTGLLCSLSHLPFALSPYLSLHSILARPPASHPCRIFTALS